MELSSIKHIDPENLSDIQSDLFIATLSYESRCITIPRKLEGISCRKVVLSRPDQTKEYAFNENLEYFRENGFEIIEVDGDHLSLDKLFNEYPPEELNVMVDCTSMVHQWYYKFFSWFSDNDHLISANLRLVYTMGRFVEENTPSKVKEVKEFLDVKKPNLKKTKRALILGLGQEPNISAMIYKIVKPDLLYLFYADPASEKQFVEIVFVNNHEVINETPIRNLISYPIRNGQTIYQSLIDVILPLRSEYSITLIPQGPKIFSLASMLLQIGYPDIMISYPVFKRVRLYDRVACGEPVVLDVLFEGGE
ncbi:MAG: hypothetical protein GY790_15675 [Bacteroidetes bacterium]|nr:hypothetical protein [Bacteroidota bacterium]